MLSRIVCCSLEVYRVESGLRVLFAGCGAYRIVYGANPRLASSRLLAAPLVASLSTLYFVPLNDRVVIHYVDCTDRESTVS